MAQSDVERRSIDTIRVLAMDSVQKANAGHPGTAMALAPVAYLIYTELLRHNPTDPAWPDRDRFVLSAGHACILQYAALHLAGYDLSLDDLKQFRQWGSRTPGHPEHFLTAGVETTTGPLGQGVANGVGFGLAERFLAQRYNRPHHEIVDHHVYAICSDGDLMEGVASEAASIAGHLGLGKLIYLYDDNRITIDGTTALSFSVEDKGARFEAYGWHVQHVHDVNDLEELRAAYSAARDEAERPSLIVAHTHIAYPAPHAIDTAKAHGSPLGEDEVRATKEVLGWDPDEHFVVPDGVYEHMSQKERGAELEAEWKARFDAWSEVFPEARADWDQVHTGRPRPGYEDALPIFEPGDDMATRDAGKKVMQALKPYVPTMLGGAADLVESTKTELEGAGVYSATHRAEHRVRHPRARHGLDRQRTRAARRDRQAVRLDLSRLLRLHASLGAPLGAHAPAGRLGWTHDSIGLGEDGPTHQPVEHYAALRAIPNLWFIRPADANETAYAWKVALAREDGPSPSRSRDRRCRPSTARSSGPRRVSGRARTCSGSRATPT